MRILAPAALLAAILSFGPPLAAAGDAARGQALYELRCGACHSESVHGRTKRVAHSVADVREWVRRWSRNLKLQWGEQEVDDVTAYLDATYYHFPCDTPACRSLSMAR